MRRILKGWWAKCPPYVVVLLLFCAAPVAAVQPDEILADPGLERRARDISGDIRCPVCQGESIDDSNAPIARDLRLIIRERLVAGDTDDEVVEYIVARYGEGVLFNPPAEGFNLVLWLAGPALFLTGIGVALLAARRRQVAEAALSPEEEKRLQEILRQ